MYLCIYSSMLDWKRILYLQILLLHQ